MPLVRMRPAAGRLLLLATALILVALAGDNPGAAARAALGVRHSQSDVQESHPASTTTAPDPASGDGWWQAAVRQLISISRADQDGVDWNPSPGPLTQIERRLTAARATRLRPFDPGHLHPFRC